MGFKFGDAYENRQGYTYDPMTDRYIDQKAEIIKRLHRENTDLREFLMWVSRVYPEVHKEYTAIRLAKDDIQGELK